MRRCHPAAVPRPNRNDSSVLWTNDCERPHAQSVRSIGVAAVLVEDLDPAGDATPDERHVVLRRVPAATVSFDHLVPEEQVPDHRLVPWKEQLPDRFQLGFLRTTD